MKKRVLAALIALSLLLCGCHNNLKPFSDSHIPQGNIGAVVEDYTLDNGFDADTGTTYAVIRVLKHKNDGSDQYPFVYAPQNGEAATASPLDVAKKEGFVLAINAGIFDLFSLKPDGIVIQNGEVVCNTPSATHPDCKPLTIDKNGNLSYAEPNADAEQLVKQGIVSAVCGFMPIIVNYQAVDAKEWNAVDHYTQPAQRQIIGQFANGDYAIITCEGRGFQSSPGWTIADAQRICKEVGLKFAYNLDGGGSTATVLKQEQLNSIYEGETGRYVPTYIVFTGSDRFDG